MFKFEGYKHQAHALNDTKADFYAFRQPREVGKPNFLELLMDKVSVVEQLGGGDWY